MLKNQATVVDRETGVEWRVERRTRGKDIDNGATAKATQTWIYILTNREGHRRFVPQERMAEFFNLEPNTPSSK
jgi:hypothetical protein